MHPAEKHLDNPNWIEDCLKWRGIILSGRYVHWCDDWDGLPVDETTPEFGQCFCFDKESVFYRGYR